MMIKLDTPVLQVESTVLLCLCLFSLVHSHSIKMRLVMELKDQSEYSSKRVGDKQKWGLGTHQSHSVVNKDDILLIGSLDTFRIHDTSSRSSEVSSSTSVCPVDIIREWEEGITRTTNSLEFLHVRIFLFFGQFFGSGVE